MIKHQICLLTSALNHVGHFFSASALLAMQTAVTARAIVSARPSVCLSVRFRCFVYVQTNEDTIVLFSASGRTIILGYGEVQFIHSQEVTPIAKALK